MKVDLDIGNEPSSHKFSKDDKVHVELNTYVQSSDRHGLLNLVSLSPCKLPLNINARIYTKPNFIKRLVVFRKYSRFAEIAGQITSVDGQVATLDGARLIYCSASTELMRD